MTVSYEQRLQHAKRIHADGLRRVENTGEPSGQKFPVGSFVKIADDLGSYMSHFPAGLYAQIGYTHAHAYGGDADSYSLFVRFEGSRWSSVAWSEEHQLTQVTDADLLAKFNEEISNNA